MLIAQLSDPHLRPRGVLYQGLVDSNAMFADAIHPLNRLSPAPDVVILSGDVPSWAERNTRMAISLRLATSSFCMEDTSVVRKFPRAKAGGNGGLTAHAWPKTRGIVGMGDEFASHAVRAVPLYSVEERLDLLCDAGVNSHC